MDGNVYSKKRRRRQASCIHQGYIDYDYCANTGDLKAFTIPLMMQFLEYREIKTLSTPIVASTSIDRGVPQGVGFAQFCCTYFPGICFEMILASPSRTFNFSRDVN